MAFPKPSRAIASAGEIGHSRAKLLSVLRWFLAAWALAGVALASWFATPYVTDPENSLRHELLMGVFIGIVVGLPPAIAQALLVAFSWRTISWPVRAIQLLPAVLLFLLVAAVAARGPI
jgi:hypothetical protein